MNRRNFVTLAVSAALAPTELIKLDVVDPKLVAASEAWANQLYASMLQTREMIAARLYNPHAEWAKILYDPLREQFDIIYLDHKDLFKDAFDE
jgi:hypothetical protein